MNAQTNWTPRPGAVTDRAINWLRENGKTGHQRLAEEIDAERQSMGNLLKRAIAVGLIIQTHEHGEYHYDVPPAPPSPLDITAAGARFVAATIEEAFEEIATANAAPTTLEERAAAAQLEEHASPINGAPAAREFIITSVVEAAYADTPEPPDDAVESWMHDHPAQAADAIEPQEVVIEHATGDDFRCAIYSDGRFVMIIGGATVILHKAPADALREYVRKHWPHDIFAGGQAAVRGSM